MSASLILGIANCTSTAVNHGTSKLDMYIFIVPHFSTTGNHNKTLLTKAYAKVAMCWCDSAISVAKSWHALTEGIIAISLRDSDPTHVVGLFSVRSSDRQLGDWGIAT